MVCHSLKRYFSLDFRFFKNKSVLLLLWIWNSSKIGYYHTSLPGNFSPEIFFCFTFYDSFTSISYWQISWLQYLSLCQRILEKVFAPFKKTYKILSTFQNHLWMIILSVGLIKDYTPIFLQNFKMSAFFPFSFKAANKIFDCNLLAFNKARTDWCKILLKDNTSTQAPNF